ncbi:hypothetical protein A6M13_06975 [Caryophanon tenue]|uniref:Uncharacterized protein n=1 Tax=Caryophanon tenue TaxID=33978 RepID=A0A1C0Y642_9BACL|nr:hypothetical protein A6M13_06975 [Caryophanon tenue]
MEKREKQAKQVYQLDMAETQIFFAALESYMYTNLSAPAAAIGVSQETHIHEKHCSQITLLFQSIYF